MKKNQSKKAAIELSMTTFVTIVLVVVVMVLGIFFIQRIFSSGTNAIESIDSQVQDQINKLFASEGTKLAIYPTSRIITFNKGDANKGFAFSVRNDDVEQRNFKYAITSTDVSKCGSSMTKEKAENYILGKEGSFILGGGNSLETPQLVLFVIPEAAPPCTMGFSLQITRDSQSYTSANFYVTVN